MACSCHEKVDPQRLRIKLANEWFRDGVVSEKTPTLYCASCESPGNVSSGKKQIKKILRVLSFSKSREDADAAGEGAMEELFMCLSCTRCFCAQHAKAHEEEENRDIADSGNRRGKRHYLFFAVPRCAKAMKTSSAPGKNRSVFPKFEVDGLEQIRESGALTLEKEREITFRPVGDSQGWVYHLWCMFCSEKPAPVSSRDISGRDKLHVHIEQIGGVIARLLFLLYEGIAIEIPVEGSALLQSNTHLGDHVSHEHSDRDLYLTRDVIQNMDTFKSPTSSVGASSFVFRGSKVRLDELVLAHVAGMENRFNNCYFNSVLQCVLKCSFFTRLLLDPNLKPMPGPLTRCLYDIALHLSKQTANDVRTHALYPYAREVLNCLRAISPLFANHDQQDSQELFLCMVNGVADEFDKGKSEEEKQRGRRLPFEGVIRTEVACSQCKSRFPREEVFMALSVPVESSLEEGLRKLFQTVKLQEKNQYACEECFKRLAEKEQERHNAAIKAENHRKTKSKRKAAAAEEKRSLNCVYSDADVSTSISRLGGTLALHLLRFQLDGSDFQKVTRNVAFPLSLDLKNFVSDEVRHEYARAHDLSDLQARFPHKRSDILLSCLKSANGDLEEAVRMLTDTEEGEVLSPAEDALLGSKAGQTPLCASGARDSACHSSGHKTRGMGCVGEPSPPFARATNGAMERQEWLPSLRRELVGIVAHRGFLHGGHYVAYVRHDKQHNTWFRCDDEEVERVDEEYVLRCQSDVYMLFYE
ncbi:putative ubiquitin hydrolase [Trypanosoma conorhini]|uniref:ubiquitinyl hydrolase 1 n=1 Tax=Trypanosoma conorhini TaxID=83891 RepID=A0A422PCX2_9TRYP|nr:putative ubiquitin hydrolase [Trypanosoma conorhini]RNF15558.1 putative ubiquitin hydrolase [Trypanosoma conorhini]